jgi:O-antigen ligase
MENFLRRLDDIADIETESAFARLLERAAFVFMVLMFAAAPLSIAATQTAWLIGMFAWFVRLFIKPRPQLVRTPLDLALWAFFGWAIVSSIFSYDPPTSFNRLRNAALFLIFYYIVNVVRTKRAVLLLAATMIFSCMVTVAWTPIERLFGRGVEISGATAESPLSKAHFQSGDTILKANGKKIKTPDDLVKEIEANEVTKVFFYRPDFYFTLEVRRENLLGGATALERLGIAGWKRSRNWRSAGFYGHYTTFAEVLQLIGSLVFGLFIAHWGRQGKRARQWDNETAGQREQVDKKKFALSSFLSFASSHRLIVTLSLLLCVAGMGFALLLSSTRGSQLGLLISAFAIVLSVGNRKMLLILAAVILPVALIGLFLLQQSRGIGFFDAQDDSIKWRQTVYREGFDLWTQNPRHFFLGVGIDSIKKHAKEWRLFDDGKLPMGHFHCTPLQLLVEQGLPALLLWLWILWIYTRLLFRRLRLQLSNSDADWKTIGIVLGSFGGVIGFFTSGLVHYNLGDAEVAMVFFILMGLSVCLIIKEPPSTNPLL